MSVALSGPPPGVDGSRVDIERLRRRAEKLLRGLGHARSELSIALVDDAAIREINRTWRGRDRATDVLSFSLVEGDHAARRGGLLGDVVISVETAARQARARRRGLDETVARLLIHGILHVLGHDHEDPAEARVMRREESRLWRSLER